MSPLFGRREKLPPPVYHDQLWDREAGEVFPSFAHEVWRWSYSHRTERHSFDTPGPGSVHWGGRRRGGRR
ncbi:MAG: hypothetical protein ACRDRY_17770 [Pseudonocardiaceae bacterium]